MTVRQWFAAVALGGLLAADSALVAFNPTARPPGYTLCRPADELARFAVALADALLVELARDTDQQSEYAKRFPAEATTPPEGF